MQVRIQSPHINMSGPQEVFIIKKFGHLDKIYNRVLRCEILCKHEKIGENKSYLIEAKLIVPGHNLFAYETAEDFEVAADRACASLESQLRKMKEKLNKRHKKPEVLFAEDDSGF